jgi:hypothetical protein
LYAGRPTYSPGTWPCTCTYFLTGLVRPVTFDQ